LLVSLYNPRRLPPATVAQLVEQTIRNRPVIGSNPIGGSTNCGGFSFDYRLFRKEKPACSPPIHMSRRFLKLPRGGCLGISVEGFLIDRQAAGLSRHTLKFYRQFLNPFIARCNANSLTLVQEVSPDYLRRYLLALSESHNPGGVHAAYRTLRAFFRWLVNEEVLPPEWKNPMLKVKPPKVAIEPLEPVSIEDVRALTSTCQRGQFTGERDRAIFLFLLDTGARAQELCNTATEDTDLNTGSVVIRYGKGGKTRTVFLGHKTRRALRSYLRMRHDRSPALFVSINGDRLTYNGLRLLLDRRATTARLHSKPTLHDFRRAFALNMLRNGADIFALQRLMGHSSLQTMRRYLAQNNEDTQLAHMRGSPVDNNL
jgi:site-specific recombinase XerD